MPTLTPLVSSAAYGVSDYLGGVASRRQDPLHVIAIAYPTSVLGTALLVPLVPGHVTTSGLAWGAASGAVMAFAIWWFYRALAVGPISVVSPVTAVLGAAIPVLVAVGEGDRPGLLTWTGIGLGLAGATLVSCDLGAGRRISARTLLLTLGAGTAFALGFVLTAQVPAGSGILPLVVARAVASAVVLAILLLQSRACDTAGRTTWAGGVRAWGGPMLVGAVDVVANATMYLTFQAGDLAVGSVVIALYPAFTVALAVLVLRERVHRVQVCGLAAAVASVLLVRVG
ncbi:MAG: DMT family transporter [Nocardioidaceae bacterium]|nr:DMT family transporter [Nocardioidaceae bacterium]